MQAYAEGFSLLHESHFPVDNAKVAHLWEQGSVVRSWLNSLAARAFEAEGNELERLEPYVEDSGEGRWTLEDAIDRRIPMPALAAVAVRALRVPRPGRLRGEGQRRAAQPVRRPRGEGPHVSTTTAPATIPTAPPAPADNPLAEGLERAPDPPDDARDLRGHRRSRPTASSCRRSTTSPTRARCPSASTSSASRAARCPTRSSASRPRPRSSSSPGASPTPRCSRPCSASCATSPGPSTTTASSSASSQALDEFDERGRTAAATAASTSRPRPRSSR